MPGVGYVLKDIHEGVDQGQLSHKQARDLRREAGEISALESRYSAGGLSDSERAEILMRLEVLHSVANAERSGTIP